MDVSLTAIKFLPHYGSSRHVLLLTEASLRWSSLSSQRCVDRCSSNSFFKWKPSWWQLSDHTVLRIKKAINFTYFLQLNFHEKPWWKTKYWWSSNDPGVSWASSRLTLVHKTLQGDYLAHRLVCCAVSSFAFTGSEMVPCMMRWRSSAWCSSVSALLLSWQRLQQQFAFYSLPVFSVHSFVSLSSKDNVLLKIG